MKAYTIVAPVSVWAWDEFYVEADNEEEALDLLREDPDLYMRSREIDNETNPDDYEWEYGRVVETTEYEDEED